MNFPYPFYFVVVPRRTSNLREVRFEEVAVLKQISALHHKNSWNLLEYLFDQKFLDHMPQVISKLSLVLHFSIWATDGPRKNRSLSAVLFWQISITVCVCLSIAFLLSSFDPGTFWGSGYSSICFNMWWAWVETWTKRLIYYYVYANVANRIVWSFVWRKFSSVGIGEWWDDMKNGQKLKLGMPMSPQEISKKYKHQSLGMPPRHPFFIGKNQVTFQYTIFLLLHILCVSLGASVVFAFSFLLSCLLQ
jgi:hypothetical protein